MAYLFDASGEYITVGTAPLPRSAGTIAILARNDWAPNDGVLHELFDVRDDPFTSLFHVVKAANNKFNAGWYTGGVDYRASAAAGSYALAQGAWHKIIVTWDDVTNVTYLYIDSTPEASYEVDLVTWDTSGETKYIGNYSAQNADWRGAVAEVIIWPRVITPGERARIDAGLLPVGGAAGDDWWPLISDGRNAWNGTVATASGATVTPHPTSIIHQPCVMNHHRRMMRAA